MFNVGGGEVLVILVLALVVLGPDKLPEAARTFGKHLGDVRRLSGGFRTEIANAMSLEPSTSAPAAEPAPAAAPASTSSTGSTAAAAARPERAPVPAGRVDPDPGDDRLGRVRADGPVESFA